MLTLDSSDVNTNFVDSNSADHSGDLRPHFSERKLERYVTSCLVERELGRRPRRKTGRRFERAFYAVDLFFVLSAFVLVHSYGAKIGRSLNFTQYIRLRLIRLYPLYLIGAVLDMCIISMYIASRMIKNFGIRDYLLSSNCASLFLHSTGY